MCLLELLRLTFWKAGELWDLLFQEGPGGIERFFLDFGRVFLFLISEFWGLFWFVLVWFLQTGLPCVALGVLKLTVDHAGLQLRDPLASASRLLELKACATMPNSDSCWFSVVNSLTILCCCCEGIKVGLGHHSCYQICLMILVVRHTC